MSNVSECNDRDTATAAAHLRLRTCGRYMYHVTMAISYSKRHIFTYFGKSQCGVFARPHSCHHVCKCFVCNFDIIMSARKILADRLLILCTPHRIRFFYKWSATSSQQHTSKVLILYLYMYGYGNLFCPLSRCI